MSLVIPPSKQSVHIHRTDQQHAPLAFFGTPRFAVPTLRLLYEQGWPISLVVTAPEKPVGRKALLTPSPIQQTAQEFDLRILSPKTLRDESFQQAFADTKPDIAIVVAYGKLIPDTILKIPRLGCINIHPSLLPAYRGPSPIRTAILDGCTTTGVSIMLLDEEMDHGPLLAQRPWQVPSGFYARACEEELAAEGARLLMETLPRYIEGTCLPQPQDHANATFTRKFQRADGYLDWSAPATNVYNRIRALSEDPGTWTHWNGKVLNIRQAHIGRQKSSGKPGSVVRTEEGISISCQDVNLVLENIQLEGARAMDASAFINGHPEFIGSEVE